MENNSRISEISLVPVDTVLSATVELNTIWIAESWTPDVVQGEKPFEKLQFFDYRETHGA